MQYLPKVKEGESQVIALDKIDQKILSSLFSRKRKTFKQIGKECRVSNEVAKYRYDRLKKRNILYGIIPIIDKNRLGYNMYSLSVKFQNLKQDKELEIIDSLVKHTFIEVIGTTAGSYDLFVIFSAKNIENANKIIEEIKEICSDYLLNFNTLFLLHENFKNLWSKDSFKIVSSTKDIEIDSNDLDILYYLSNDGLMSIKDISKKTNIIPETVRYKLNKLHKSNVIVGYLPLVNVNLLGYNYLWLSVGLKKISDKERKQFEAYLIDNKSIIYFQRTSGSFDYAIDFNIKHVSKIRHFLMDIRSVFSDIIKDYETGIYFRDYKSTFLPKGVIKELKKEK